MWCVDSPATRPQGPDLTRSVLGLAVVAACGLVLVLASPSPIYAGGMCPDSPSGGGQTMSATATKGTNCSVTNGMYVRPFTTLRLDAIATAFGQCQIVLPHCTTAGCVCVPSATIQERTINHIYSWVDITSQSLNATYPVGRVYGKNPNGTGAFWHVLDTTQSNSTGPINFGVGTAGQYALHLQANINTTACNITPNVTPQVDITVYARTTLHRGERTNGSLVGAVRLPSGQGYYHYWGDDNLLNPDDWGGAELMNWLIQTVGIQWYQNNPTVRFGFGDISRQNGGPFMNNIIPTKQDHAEHQNGLDIDIRYVRTDGLEQRLNLADPNQRPLFDRGKTIDLLRLFANNGALYRILVSPLTNITSADVPNANIVDSTGHDDHFHVSLMDPDGPDSNNCP